MSPDGGSPSAPYALMPPTPQALDGYCGGAWTSPWCGSFRVSAAPAVQSPPASTATSPDFFLLSRLLHARRRVAVRRGMMRGGGGAPGCAGPPTDDLLPSAPISKKKGFCHRLYDCRYWQYTILYL
ncbi:hypothetical protein STCU_10113 [Strigomonas culicis]|uniref:Uncharacterized protein n=1 Tax=Strigomonas culicis TaxID=28005 RepID=S9TP67_9TRYP|nr:hypothetical protein STCU_10113 [Strigomonas culicis]|eukprot:EPY18223.1 hypothetical protein STCU_10113 [Strigomonas culicis]